MMERIQIPTAKAYDVLVGRGLFDELGAQAARTLRGRECAVVSDSNVAPLYLSAALESLRGAGFTAHSFVFPAGEAGKCGENYLSLLNFLAEKGLSRADALIALGGGVVGDLTGFAAATYLRGVAWVQVPTTLLACVDSSVGGKTAIDLPAGKNLAGAFYQPDLVLCDPRLMDTLPERVRFDGCAEVIKYGMIGSAELLEQLAGPALSERPEAVVARCIEMKRDIVCGDEFDRGDRQILNLGHSFGHAAEALSGFALSHGQAVAIGLRLITRAALERGLCPEICLSTLDALLEKYRLPGRTQFSAAEIARAAHSDKKRAGAFITLAVPRGLGQSALMRVPLSELGDWAEAGVRP